MAYWNKRGGGLFVPKARPFYSWWIDQPREGMTAKASEPDMRDRMRNCREYDYAPGGEHDRPVKRKTSNTNYEAGSR